MSGVEIETDGACHGSTRVGSLGIVFVNENKIIYQFNKQDTNNLSTSTNIVIYTHFNSGCWLDELNSVERELFKLICRENDSICISAVKFDSRTNSINFNFSKLFD